MDNDGSFPTFSAGLAIDVPFSSANPWCFELGAPYVWAPITHTLPASSELAPGSTVMAETDFTAHDLWIGIGTRF